MKRLVQGSKKMGSRAVFYSGLAVLGSVTRTLCNSPSIGKTHEALHSSILMGIPFAWIQALTHNQENHT